MKKTVKFLSSMQMTGTLLLVFAVAIACATFIETARGTDVAQVLVYKATWFEILLLLLAINMTMNIIVNKMYIRAKLTIFIFHVGFLVVFLGSAITRYVGFEGVLHIRENTSESKMLSSEPYFQVTIGDGNDIQSFEKQIVFTPSTGTGFATKIKHADKTITVRRTGFMLNPVEEWQDDPQGKPVAHFVALGPKGHQDFTISQGENLMLGNFYLSFGGKTDSMTVQLLFEDSLMIRAPYEMLRFSMMHQAADTLQPDSNHVLASRVLYQIGDYQVVLKDFRPKAKLVWIESTSPEHSSEQSAVKFEVSDGTSTNEVVVFGSKGTAGKPETIKFGKTEIALSYGSKPIELPFAIQLNKFELERYPGSGSPSSYSSEVTVLDKANNVEKPFRIFMNNVLAYRGYRFYQSSYDNDEKGTILSVNHDTAGTIISYLGYILLAVGMFLSIFNKNSYFHRLTRLGKTIREKRFAATLLALCFILPFSASAQDIPDSLFKTVDKQTAASFGKLLVLDPSGRVEPLNTMNNELIRKVTRSSKFKGLTPDQVVLSMLMYPHEWQQIKMIKIANDQLKEILGIEGKYASFSDLVDFTSEDNYKLRKQVEEAYAKIPATRNLFDKEVLKADERLNICYMIYSAELFSLFPDPKDPKQAWYTVSSTFSGMSLEDSTIIRNSLSEYVELLRQAKTDADKQKASALLGEISKYQLKYGKELLPSDTRLSIEVMYNRLQIFKSLFPLYTALGFIWVVFLFFSILFPELKTKRIGQIAMVILIAGFIAHTAGLGMRWYLSGHAPWSNGYESMIYVAWAAMLAGLIFARKTPMALAATAVLAGLTLFVAHLSWMDPEITNLVPVLKSYWLTFHVAIITASYGFIGLSAVLGLLNLVFMIIKSPKNTLRIEPTISELTHINHQSLILGLYFLTIGTFLGGVWANESWGRYWGWDPKETWSLITILVYTFILHMRMIPGLKSRFSFNFASLIGFSCVIMTYLGVNYYLSGLHSYGKGEAVPIPVGVYISLVLVAILAGAAYIREIKNDASETIIE